MRLLYHPDVLLHDTGGHPENKKRLEAFPHLEAIDRLQDAERYLSLVHPEWYVEQIREWCQAGRPPDAETLVSKGSFEAAVAAVGTSLHAMDSGDFALVRPPGHHAFRTEAHGFCLFNNVAIAAQKAVNEGKKVLILDIDGHLGDGTLDIFYEDDRVLYWSIHQYPAYPGNGSAAEIGAGAGKGYSVNIPLPAGSGDDILLHALRYCWPIAQQFEPDVVAVSAGFDAHQFDPLLQLKATGHFFYQTGLLLSQTFPGKIFAVLEGGYNTAELPHCVYNFVAGINQEPMPHPEATTSSGLRVWEIYEMHLYHAAALLAKYWKFQ